MLTSHHYLLGGLMAVSCATGILSHGVATLQNGLPISSESATTEAVDVSYRGSGRLDETPDNQKSEAYTDSDDGYRDRGPLAHRGSGRIRPQAL